MTNIPLQRALKALLAVVLVGLALHATAEQAKDNPPNILIISIDDLNDWVGCMDGHPQAKTPNIDRLAQRGVLFNNAHCQAPICGPSRASLWTGLYPHHTGIYGQIRSKSLANHPMVKDNPDRYISTYFKKHGYKTMAAGKLFHGDGGHKAFDTYGDKFGGFGPKPEKRFAYNHPPDHSTQTDWGAYPERDEDMPDDKVAAWAIEQLEKKHDKPIFIAAGFWRPHVPFYVPQKWFDLFPIGDIIEPAIKDDDLDDMPAISRKVHALPMMPKLDWMREENQIGNVTQAYLACIAFVDYQVGRVLDALEQSAIADNTIVVLWSDHGYHLGEKHRWAKHGLWEEATKVPLIIAGPGISGQQSSGASVGLIDLYPTLVELARLPANPTNQGLSLTELMDPESDVGWDRPILTTYSFGNHALRDERYRYIRYEDGSEELYDHQTDPNEWTNLADEQDQVKRIIHFRQLLPVEQSLWYPDSRGPKTKYHDQNKARYSDN